MEVELGVELELDNYLVGGGGAIHHLTAPLLLSLTPGQLQADLPEPGREHALFDH